MTPTARDGAEKHVHISNEGTKQQDFLEDIRAMARHKLSENQYDGGAAVILGLVGNAIERRDQERRESFERVTALRLALRDLLDAYGDDPCRLDHHGFCQAHFVERGCSVAAARKVLEEG